MAVDENGRPVVRLAGQALSAEGQDHGPKNAGHNYGAVRSRSKFNAYVEWWIRSVKEEALSRLILFGERALQHVLTEYVTHFHQERPHQGKGNVVLMPAPDHVTKDGSLLRCHARLGGLLKYYAREAA